MIVVVLAVGIVLIGAIKRLDLYAVFIEGAQEGMKTALQVIPYLCAALLIIAFLRGSGVLDFAQSALEPLFLRMGLPKEILSFLLIRPVSGSGSLSVLQDMIARFGVDSTPAIMAAAIMGSSETTLYVISLYLGSVNMRYSRYCVAVSLISAMFGTIFAIISLKII